MLRIKHFSIEISVGQKSKISTDKGNSWQKARDLTPEAPEYAGWKFNNIQPVKDSKGNVKEGMLLFYGWKDSEEPRGKAFLLVEGAQE